MNLLKRLNATVTVRAEGTEFRPLTGDPHRENFPTTAINAHQNSRGRPVLAEGDDWLENLCAPRSKPGYVKFVVEGPERHEAKEVIEEVMGRKQPCTRGAILDAAILSSEGWLVGGMPPAREGG